MPTHDERSHGKTIGSGIYCMVELASAMSLFEKRSQKFLRCMSLQGFKLRPFLELDSSSFIEDMW